MIQKLAVQAASGFATVSLIRPRTAREIDSCDLLIEGICRQAARDLTCKNQKLQIDAMDFFRSRWFVELTGLDGEEIISKLLDSKKRR